MRRFLTRNYLFYKKEIFDVGKQGGFE